MSSVIESLKDKLSFETNKIQNLNKVDFYPLEDTKKIIEDFVSEVEVVLEKTNTPPEVIEKVLFDEEIRKTISKTKLIVLLLIPIILHIGVNTLTEILKLNLEGLTGGFFRVITGVLAYTSLELLITVGFLWSYFRVTLIRFNTQVHKHTLLDFLQDYTLLSPWERIKTDFLVFSYVSLLVVINTIVLLVQLQEIS